jgi:hypothetical protein
MKRSLLVPLLIGSLLWVGCGSTGDEQGLAPFSPAPAYQGYFLGRVKLAPELREGPVELQTLDGTTLLQLQANKNGWFYHKGVVPPNFRAVARRGADTYQVEFRGTWPGGTLYINAGTTLAASLMRARPSLSFEEAERKIQRFYSLPPQFKLSWFSVIESRGFQSDRFFQAVKSAGSLESYLAILVARIESGAVFEDSFVGSVLTDLGKAVFTGPAGAAINDTAGAVVSKCGDNFTTAGALSQIENDLNTISQQIKELSDQFQVFTALGELQKTLSDLKGNGIAINSAVTQIAQTAAARQALTDSTSPSPVPVPYNQPVDETQALQLNKLSSDHDDLWLQTQYSPIQNAINDTGPNGIYQKLVKAQMTELHLESDSSYNGYPWRTVGLTNQQLAVMGPLLNSLEQATYLTTEIASVTSGDQGVNLLKAQSVARELAHDIQLGAQQVPDGMYSGDILYDLGNQTMWLADFQSVTDFDSAKQLAHQVRIGPYDGFDIPTRSQLSALINTRVINGTTRAGSGGQWEDSPASDWQGAFAKLGFGVSYYGDVVEGSSNQSDLDNQGAYCEDDHDGMKPLIYWWNGTSGGPATNPSTNSATEARADSTSYLLQRIYGTGLAEERYSYLAPTPLPAFNYYQPGPSPAMAGIVGQLTAAVDPSNSLQLQAKAKFFGGTSIANFFYGFVNSSNYIDNEFDVTQRAAWTSSDEQTATVSNFLYNRDGSAPSGTGLPGPVGRITWHPNIETGNFASSQVTFTAQYFGIDDASGTSASLHTASHQMSPPQGLKPVLDHVYATPFNRRYNLASLTNVTIPVTLLAVYADGQLKDVSQDSNTIWTLYDANGQVLHAQNLYGFDVLSGSRPNELFLSLDLPTTTVTYTATYTNQWGSASVNGTMAVQLPYPSITQMSPTFGPASGGTPVQILGTGFTPGSRVSFNGVPAPGVTFNSPTQLTVLTPPLGRSITSPVNVPVVVSLPSGGSSSGNQFTYTP